MSGLQLNLLFQRQRIRIFQSLGLLKYMPDNWIFWPHLYRQHLCFDLHGGTQILVLDSSSIHVAIETEYFNASASMSLGIDLIWRFIGRGAEREIWGAKGWGTRD